MLFCGETGNQRTVRSSHSILAGREGRRSRKHESIRLQLYFCTCALNSITSLLTASERSRSYQRVDRCKPPSPRDQLNLSVVLGIGTVYEHRNWVRLLLYGNIRCHPQYFVVVNVNVVIQYLLKNNFYI